MTHSARIARASLRVQRRAAARPASFADTPAAATAWRRFRRASEVLAARRARASADLAAVFGETT